MINKGMQEELYHFIVGSNLEHSLVNQCTNQKRKQDLKKWLQI
jgi:hypothetical protein